MNTVPNIHTDNHNSVAISTQQDDTFTEIDQIFDKTFHTEKKDKNLNENIKKIVICECDNINWMNYNELEHNLELCKSCYCKFMRDEISYKDYENECCMSFKNSGRKFKDICMVAT